MSYTKTILRTIFYQFLLLFVGLSLGFIANAEWVGFKSVLLERSLNNIFNPIRFDENVLHRIKEWGAFKIWSFYDRPEDFSILEEAVLAEEWYWVKFTYTDNRGIKHTEIESTRVRWKPWEYYYEDNAQTEEEFIDYLENGNLNSQESDKAFKLMKEKKEKAKDQA
jgi:hypothetical protein